MSEVVPIRESFLERPLPSSDDSERVILGAILLDNSLISQAIEHLRPEDFYSPFNRKVFEAMITLFDCSSSIDPVLIGEELKKSSSLESIGGVSAITSLTYGLPHLTAIREYISVVRDHSMTRKLVRACNSICSRALAGEEDATDLIDQAQQAIYEIRSGTNSVLVTMASEGVARSIAAAKLRRETGSTIIGVPSGLSALDTMLQGFRSGQHIIIAARPSVGKTALANRIAYHIAVREAVPVFLFEMEMSKEEISDRMICAEADIDGYLLRSGFLSSAQWDAAEEVRMQLEKGFPYIISDSPFVTTRTIRNELRRINAPLIKGGGKGVGVVVVDHIGLMQNSTEKKGRNREGEVSEISRELKRIAREFDCVVITLCQMNRQVESRSDHRPVMSDLRESGAIEQDADVVMMIYREDMYQPDTSQHTGIAELIITKNRNGPTGSVKLHFARKTAKFSDLSQIATSRESNSGGIIL